MRRVAVNDEGCEVTDGESAGTPRAALFSDNTSCTAERQLRPLYANLVEAQRVIRETVLDARSTDGYVSLRITGDRFATSVHIAPQLVRLGIPALERSVLEAINSAAVAVERLAIEQMGQIAAQAGVFGPAEAASRHGGETSNPSPGGIT
jgi:DNA-binding protein YbaB